MNNYKECPECGCCTEEPLKVCNRHDVLYCGKGKCSCVYCKQEKEQIALQIKEAIKSESKLLCYCGRKPQDHPISWRHLDANGNPCLRVLCNGRLVKI